MSEQTICDIACTSGCHSGDCDHHGYIAASAPSTRVSEKELREALDDLSALEQHLDEIRKPCPGGCGCLIGQTNPDASECGCDSYCTTDPDEWPALPILAAVPEPAPARDSDLVPGRFPSSNLQDDDYLDAIAENRRRRAARLSDPSNG